MVALNVHDYGCRSGHFFRWLVELQEKWQRLCCDSSDSSVIQAVIEKKRH